MRILVAGGAGFIGSHLVDRLLDQDHRVTVVDNFITGRRSNLAHREMDHRLDVVEMDVASPEILSWFGRTPEPFDRVYHLASPASPLSFGRFPIETLVVNSAGTMNLLRLARSSGARFFLASTSEIYGEPEVHPQSEDYWGRVHSIGPRSCYDEGKRFAESLTVTFGRIHGVDVRIARLFNTYGPRVDIADGRVIPNFCVQALRGEPLTIYGDGTQTRSLCYVADTVRGMEALMETADVAGEVVNIGNPDEYTVLEIAQAIRTATDSSSETVFHLLPAEDPSRRRPDISKARRLLNWQPTTTFRDGLSLTLEALGAELVQLQSSNRIG